MDFNRSIIVALFLGLSPLTSVLSQEAINGEGVSSNVSYDIEGNHGSYGYDFENENYSNRSIPLDDQPERIYMPDTTSALSAAVGII